MTEKEFNLAIVLMGFTVKHGEWLSSIYDGENIIHSYPNSGENDFTQFSETYEDIIELLGHRRVTND